MRKRELIKTKVPLHWFIAALVMMVLVGSGCATIINGSDQQVNITSDPEDAEIKIIDSYNMEIWTSRTPDSVTLARGDGFFKGAKYRIEITKKGFEPKVIQLRSKLNGGWYLAGNLLFGGWIGWLIVDPISGAMWKLEPNDISTSLDASGSAWLQRKDEGIHIVLVKEIEPALLKELSLKKVN